MNSKMFRAWIIFQYCVTIAGASKPATRNASALSPFCAITGPWTET